MAEMRLVDGLAGRTLSHPEMPRAVANDIPEWLEPHLARAFGKELEREMAALNTAAPIDLRVNLLKADRETARRALLAEGIAAEPTPLSPIGLRLRKRAPLSGLAAFKAGLFDVQDEGSQIAALIAGARPGMRVVDFCAGAGGKTLALAAGMANRGKLIACDVSDYRLERAALRLRRAGVDNVERRALSSEHDKWVKHHTRRFDRVFVDAPCLGTGTWRRNPDAKWRAQPDDLEELIERQQQILRSASRLVRPGGRLIYATCSLLHEEDEAQADAFLAQTEDFALVPASRAWAGNNRRRLACRRSLPVPDPRASRDRWVFCRRIRTSTGRHEQTTRKSGVICKIVHNHDRLELYVPELPSLYAQAYYWSRTCRRLSVRLGSAVATACFPQHGASLMAAVLH